MIFGKSLAEKLVFRLEQAAEHWATASKEQATAQPQTAERMHIVSLTLAVFAKIIKDIIDE